MTFVSHACEMPVSNPFSIQAKPIHNKFKKRSCHIKLMIVDGHIAIQGSGNQDTQSW